MQPPADELIDLREALPLLRRAPFSALVAPLERALGFARINEIHRLSRSTADEGPDYFRHILELLDVTYELPEGDLPRIPAKGPVIVVSNHPFGCVDGIILLRILSQLRDDSKILGNFLLDRIPKVGAWSIPVDPFGGKDAARRNLASMRAALDHLKGGGLLGTFPGGTVSHFHPGEMRVTDPAWNRHVAALVRKSGATVVPVYFSGHNSFLFQLAGLLSAAFRTALLGCETVNKAGRKLHLRIGRPIPFSRLKDFESDEQLTGFLRVSSYLLRNRLSDRAHPVSIEPSTGETIVAPLPQEHLALEVARLPLDNLLLEQGDLAVYVAPAAAIPHVLHEIGRLREITFREVGEGTGKPIDIDRFDNHYHHLFLWNRAENDIVGAYRLCKVDRVLATLGPAGLYTRTLFKYRPGFLENLGPAIEMGRSFIVSRYQQKHNSLSLLWKGIGEIVNRDPDYKILFGPVSITQEYNRLSKNLLVRFMVEKLRHPRLSRFVRASNPFRGIHLMGVSKEDIAESVRSIEDVSALISEIEEDGKGIPVLLRQYLRMNALLLSFNVDKNFSNALDGLMIVDLSETDPRLLKRYLGDEGLRRFQEHHSLSVSVSKGC